MTEILTFATNGLGHITLNRPQALHALNTHMCANMIQALLAWRDDPDVYAVLLDHAPGTRGFCAGGDIRMIAESGAGDGKDARAFFFTEYRLNHLLFHYPKPVVALIDGVTMGGGVGISMPARFRIATENTTYAMPETGIGLFPDVGGGWYLPRKPGAIGMWLALTGARLKAADCLIAGIATHYVEAAKLAELREALTQPSLLGGVGGVGGTGGSPSGENTAVTPTPNPAPQGGGESIAQTLARFATSASAPRELTPDNVERINRIFAKDSVEQILAALEGDASDWAKAQLATLRTKSPQTLRVTFRQLREGARMTSFKDEMRQEYRIACRVSAMHDFQEGVRAVVIDKDNKPAWNPSTLDGVTDALLDAIFAPLPPGEEWTPL
ncbi:MAG: enoyl-CoA hydratase/isomerase family protein [Hyphomonadaceae bacterium]